MDIVDVKEFVGGPQVFEIKKNTDSRGAFEMLFDEQFKLRRNMSLPDNLVQLNCIESYEGALRGFHGAAEIDNHWKFVTCIQGEIIDAYLDLRAQSTTFGKIAFLSLNSDSKRSVLIPPGFAHAMQGSSQTSLVVYGSNKLYASQKEIDISPIKEFEKVIWRNPLIISERDSQAQSLRAYKNSLTKKT
jgi:dTDP-4-dehydrorhamnose 3,5-epimerase